MSNTALVSSGNTVVYKNIYKSKILKNKFSLNIIQNPLLKETYYFM